MVSAVHSIRDHVFEEGSKLHNVGQMRILMLLLSFLTCGSCFFDLFCYRSSTKCVSFFRPEKSDFSDAFPQRLHAVISVVVRILVSA